MPAMSSMLFFVMATSALAEQCDVEILGACPSAGTEDASALIQSRTSVVHDQERVDESPPKFASINHTAFMQMTGAEQRFHRSHFISVDPNLGLKATFDDVAVNNKWGSQESISGQGSELFQTALVQSCLGKWIKKYNIKVFVDIPCGDANWQAHIPGLEQISYKGYDIADQPVNTARKKNSKNTWMAFDQLDLSSNVPPVDNPDIIMVRDVIQHLPLKTGHQMLLNAKKSGARYLAVSSFSDGKSVDIPAGSFYKNDVHASPFNLPSSIESCQNWATVMPTCHLELIDLSAWNPSD